MKLDSHLPFSPAVPELTKPASAQPSAPQISSGSHSPGPTPSASPSPATLGSGSAAAPLQGGNNAKRLTGANGQPGSNTISSATASGPSPAGNGSANSGAQTPQQQPRYMPREVPPRFRCQQDHKVLLKRGQPPLSSMLLGGGGGGDGPNANMAATCGKCQQSFKSNFAHIIFSINNELVFISDSVAASSSTALTSSSVAAASTTSNYANSMWGVSSGSQTSSQGREKVIVDGNDLEEWPSIAGNDGARAPFTGLGGGSGNNGKPVNSISASGNQSSPTSSFSVPNECIQSSNGVAWGVAASQGHLSGGNAVAASGPLQQPSSLSKASALLGSHDASGSIDGSSAVPGANFNPNANPSAWPALVQQDGPVAAEGLSSFHPQVPGGSVSANNSDSLGQGLGGGTIGMLGGHPPLSVNQSSTHQRQLHQMQSRDREMGGGKWDSDSAGPKIAGVDGIGGIDHSVGTGEMSVADHNLASSWRGQPSYPAANSKTGASKTDGREDGGTIRAAEGDNGTSGWGYPSSASGVSAWSSAGTGGNSSQVSGESQGGWGSSGVGGERGVSGGDWGGNSTVVCGVNPGSERVGGASSSNSSSSGGSTAGNAPATSSTSSTATTMTSAWDNQKGEGETGEWSGEGEGPGAQGGSSSSGGNSRNGSGLNSTQGRSRRPAPNAEAALQKLLSRSDLDPRVLSNTGWGQTQIRQNTSWDMEDHGGQIKGGSSSATSKHPSCVGDSAQHSSGPRTQISDSIGPGASSSLVPPAGSSGEGWESSSNSSSSGASLSGRAPPSSGPNIRNLGVSQSGPSATTGPGMGLGVVSGHNQQGKATGWGGGGIVGGDGQEATAWGKDKWGESSRGNGAGWSDLGQQDETVGGRWGGNQPEKGTGGWKELGGNVGGSGWGSVHKVGTRRDWEEQQSKSNSGGGEDEKKFLGNSGGDSGAGGWGDWDGDAPRRTWGADSTGVGGTGGVGMNVIGGMGSKPQQNWSGGNKMHQMPNSLSGPVTGPQAPLQQQQSQPSNQHPQRQQALDQGPMKSGGGRKPISQAQNQNQSSGWTTGPIPGGCGGVGSGSEASGWEEPSPQSLSRKNEIDDGTSAWGDPTHYNYKPVNLWDKNSAPAGQQPHGQGQAKQQQQQPQQQGPPMQQQTSRQAVGLGGNRDFSTVHGPGKTSSSGKSAESFVCVCQCQLVLTEERGSSIENFYFKSANHFIHTFAFVARLTAGIVESVKLCFLLSV